MYCPNCGEQLTEGAKFCMSCGHSVPQLQVPAAQAEQSPLVPPQQPYIQPGAQQSAQQQYQQQYQRQQQQQQQQPYAQPGAPQPAQQQYQQPFYSPPVLVKPKSKTLFIIGGAAALVVVFVVVMIITKGFGVFDKTGGDSTGVAVVSGVTGGSASESPGVSTGNTGDNKGDSTSEHTGEHTGSPTDGVTITDAPESASDEEKLAYECLGAIAAAYQAGMEFEEAGGYYFADGCYALAASGASAMRYATDCLLEIKGVPPVEDGRLRDWNAIAAIGWVSQLPWLYEGVVFEARGDTSGAAECYRKAALNTYYIGELEDWKIIRYLDLDELINLKAELEALEDRIYNTTFGPRFINIPRDENNFDVDFLNQKAKQCLNDDEDDIIGALVYFQAALQINPLDGDNYANTALMYIFLEDSSRYNDLIFSGLAADPENVRLKLLLNTLEEAS